MNLFKKYVDSARSNVQVGWKRRLLNGFFQTFNIDRTRLIGRPPFQTAAFWTAALSPDHHVVSSSEWIVQVALDAASRAQTISLHSVAERAPEQEQRRYITTWPGEHYRFLAGLMQVVEPRLVVEVGTASGMSALTMLVYSPATSKIVTFDVVPWQAIPNTLFRPEDFDSGRLEQRIGNLAMDDCFQANSDLLVSADIVFIDAPKDGVFEPKFIPDLLKLLAGTGGLVVIDDIHYLNMLGLWENITLPKFDATSLGHASGTGLVDLRER